MTGRHEILRAPFLITCSVKREGGGETAKGAQKRQEGSEKGMKAGRKEGFVGGAVAAVPGAIGCPCPRSLSEAPSAGAGLSRPSRGLLAGLGALCSGCLSDMAKAAAPALPWTMSRGRGTSPCQVGQAVQTAPSEVGVVGEMLSGE